MYSSRKIYQFLKELFLKVLDASEVSKTDLRVCSSTRDEEKRQNPGYSTLIFSVIFASENIGLATFKRFFRHPQAAVVSFLRFTESEKVASSLSF